MNFYFKVIGNSIKSKIAYKNDIWIKLIGRIFYLYVQVCVWKGFYESNNTLNLAQNLNDILCYVMISNLVAIFVESSTIEYVNERIQKGDICIDLMRPVKFILYVGSHSLGEIIVNLLFQIAPIIAFSVILGFRINNIIIIFPFAIILVLAMLINFLFLYFIGILAFWFQVTWPINMIVRALHKLLSGAWIPLWIFPDLFRSFLNYLPFQYVYYLPASFGTKNYFDKYEFFSILFGQMMWIILLLIIINITWFYAKKKLVIQGG